jgi:hypothetical protein
MALAKALVRGVATRYRTLASASKFVPLGATSPHATEPPCPAV